MTETIVLKIIIGTLIASIGTLNIKIIWDWIKKKDPTDANTDILKIKPELKNLAKEI